MQAQFFPANGLVFSNGLALSMSELNKPWMIEANTVETLAISDCLCRIDGLENFYHVIKELWRVAKANAMIEMCLPHPRHDIFISDPEYVRQIIPATLQSFKRNDWQNPLPQRLGVDFIVLSVEVVLDQHWRTAFDSGAVTEADIAQVAQQAANVIEWQNITWKVCKDISVIDDELKNDAIGRNEPANPYGMTSSMLAQLIEQKANLNNIGKTEEAKTLASFLKKAGNMALVSEHAN